MRKPLVSFFALAAASLMLSCEEDLSTSFGQTEQPLFKEVTEALRKDPSQDPSEEPTLKKLGQACIHDSECEGATVQGNAITPVCKQGVCALTFEGACHYDSPLRGDFVDSTHCPAQTQCISERDDHALYHPYCVYACQEPTGDELWDPKCEGICSYYQYCETHGKPESDFLLGCTPGSDKLCNPITSCYAYEQCVKESHCENYDSDLYHSVNECLDAQCRVLAADANIVTAYNELQHCMATNCSDASTQEEIEACRSGACNEAATACAPVDGDNICAPSENRNSSPADCYKCGDGVCTPNYETATNCKSDCAPTQVTVNSCQEYNACIVREMAGTNPEGTQECAHCPGFYYENGFATPEACEDYFCIQCKPTDESYAAPFANFMTCAASSATCRSARTQEEISACIQGCSSTMGACSPVQDGDGECNFLESGLGTSPQDCHECNDHTCDADYGETVANCALDCATEPLPNDQCAQAVDVSAGGIFPAHNLIGTNSTITLNETPLETYPGNDVFFKFTLAGTSTVTLTTGPDLNQGYNFPREGYHIDTVMELYEGEDCDHFVRFVESNDDYDRSRYSRIEKVLEAGTYYVLVDTDREGNGSTGTFALTVEIEGASCEGTVDHCVSGKQGCDYELKPICRECISGYNPGNNRRTCCKSLPHCDEASYYCDDDGENSRCGECESGYQHHTENFSVCCKEIPNCISHTCSTNGESSKCASCDSGYRLHPENNAVCCKDIPRCLHVTCDADGESSTCPECAPGYKPSADGKSCDAIETDAEVDAETDGSTSDAEVDAETDGSTSDGSTSDAETDAETDGSTSDGSTSDASTSDSGSTDASTSDSGNATPAEDADLTADADAEDSGSGGGGCSAQPSPASNAFFALFALPFLAIRRRK